MNDVNDLLEEALRENDTVFVSTNAGAVNNLEDWLDGDHTSPINYLMLLIY